MSVLRSVIISVSLGQCECQPEYQCEYFIVTKLVSVCV